MCFRAQDDSDAAPVPRVGAAAGGEGAAGPAARVAGAVRARLRRLHRGTAGKRRRQRSRLVKMPRSTHVRLGGYYISDEAICDAVRLVAERIGHSPRLREYVEE